MSKYIDTGEIESVKLSDDKKELTITFAPGNELIIDSEDFALEWFYEDLTNLLNLRKAVRELT